MAELPFWPRAKYSSASRTSVRCRWRTSSAIFSQSAVVRARAETKLAWRSRWMTCEATGGGLEVQALADQLFGFRIDVAEGADGARGLADAHVFGGGAEAGEIAAGLFVPDGQFEPEGDRLGVDSVGAADLHGVPELQGAALEDLAQLLQVVQQDRARPAAAGAPARYPRRRWRSGRSETSARLRRGRARPWFRLPRW